jgi:hypothetical protein
VTASLALLLAGYLIRVNRGCPDIDLAEDFGMLGEWLDSPASPAVRVAGVSLILAVSVIVAVGFHKIFSLITWLPNKVLTRADARFIPRPIPANSTVQVEAAPGPTVLEVRISNHCTVEAFGEDGGQVRIRDSEGSDFVIAADIVETCFAATKQTTKDWLGTAYPRGVRARGIAAYLIHPESIARIGLLDADNVAIISNLTRGKT